MNKLQQLIQELCPNGVEWKTLGEVAIQLSGMSGVSNKWAETGNCRFIDYLNAYNHLKIDVDDLPFATIKNLNQTTLKQGDILFTSASETPDECAISSVIEQELVDGVLLDDHLFGIRVIDNYSNKIHPVFLNYFFHSPDFRKIVNKTVRGVTRFYISKTDFMKLSIPVPPLAIQTEIARILDKFSTLTAELQAELQARKSQYEYYRNQLLDYPMEESDQPSLRSSQSATSIKNDDNLSQQISKLNPHTDNSVLQPRGKVEWKKLGEIGTLKIGRRFVRTDIQDCGVPCFHYGDLYTYYGLSTKQTKGYLSEELAKKLRYAQPNDVIIVCAGENDMDIGVGVAWLGDKPAVVHDACCILHHNQNPKYISHFLRTHNYHLQIKKYVKNGKISSLPLSGLEKAIIPIPPLAEQERIVTILDKFDTLTNSITEGLPKEIELRQKQYEYYRDMLLTFPQK